MLRAPSIDFDQRHFRPIGRNHHSSGVAVDFKTFHISAEACLEPLTAGLLIWEAIPCRSRESRHWIDRR
jgi:hypothetical protein